jgi:hypothetical protein
MWDPTGEMEEMMNRLPSLPASPKRLCQPWIFETAEAVVVTPLTESKSGNVKVSVETNFKLPVKVIKSTEERIIIGRSAFGFFIVNSFAGGGKKDKVEAVFEEDY